MLRILGVVLALVAGGARAAGPNTVRVVVSSKVDEELAVYWINTWKKGALVRQKEEAIVARGLLNIDSFVGHSFLVVEEAHTPGLTKYDNAMWNPAVMTMFTMGEFDLEANISRDEVGNLKVDLESAFTRTTELMKTASAACRSDPAVVKALAKRRGLAAAEGSCTISAAGGGDGDDDDDAANELSPEFAECLTKAIAGDLAKKEKEANKSMRMLEAVGDRARNYTCADPAMETSNTSLSTVNWKDPDPTGAGLTYKAKLFLDEPAAKIYLLDSFATDAECQALKDRASPHLQDATVNGGSGQSTLSSARRAKAGGVAADLNVPESKTAGLYRRGYAFANYVTGYKLPLEGQEGYSVIKYGADDEYRPHCDGDCTGADFRQGGRVATMVIYCEQAKVGGGTTFSSSDVFVNGKKGQAVFFSYLGPDNKTDIGRTRHSGCPILKGTKWIATLWMRLGVTAEKNWQYYDPSGMPSAFAQAKKGGTISATDAATMSAQESAVDGAESAATAAAAATVRETQGKEEANDSASAGAGDGAAAAAPADRRAMKEDGILSGIAGSISSMFS